MKSSSIVPTKGEVGGYWQKRRNLAKVAQERGYKGNYAYMAAGAPPWRRRG